mmetsp:Transcript_15255/g.30385  ORF Transcript_15255/g.30385 Transcript_15255/m.30385 type:complete len:81 (+) Transcript_15255:518-760(+)
MGGELGDRLRTLEGTDPLLTGVPSASQFDVIELSGTQFKVPPNGVHYTEKLMPISKWSVGSAIVMSSNVVSYTATLTARS